MKKPQAYYPNINANPNFSTIEEQIIDRWQRNNTFIQSIELNVEKNDFVFYDGPPFANGLPHYGHLLTGFIKDIVARYQTMCGKRVARRFGWDCHGLPAEIATEKELNISGRVAIEKFGIDKFNDHCRRSVLKYTDEWQYYVKRQGRWVDFENDYKTMDLSYMESVIWAFKTLYDNGLIYRSSRVMPYSWACETPVSDFETRMDNSYREKQSKTATVAVHVNLQNNTSCEKFLSSFYNDTTHIKSVVLLIWTTTPWTLPSNLAIAVGRNVEYAIIMKDDTYYIVASALTNKYKNEIGDNIIGVCNGEKLVGLQYIPIFPYFTNHRNAFRVLAGDFVTTEDGTGIVHMAPGFGEDDQKLCTENDIEIVCPVDDRGRFISPIEDFIGMHVFDTNDQIIQILKSSGDLIKLETYTHNYPFCWRTDTPLIYRAVPSWYLNVTAIKGRMIINNQQINWIPNHIKNGLFGKWLENARDWSISRNRYWGCPIPVWESDDAQYPHVEVYGSIAAIEQSFSVKIDDLHLPFIDSLTKLNPSDPTGKSHLRRVPEVLDCWFESGSMPYAQVHYPFENKDWFDENFPADFIVEYVAQTRGWFYTLLVLSTALFDRAPFLNCICHGVILGDGGQKMSKRLNNYPDPKDIFAKYGADALRWFMMSSPVMRGQELIIDKEAIGIQEAIRSIIKPLWSAYKFFTLYANIDGIKAAFTITSQVTLLDRYIIAKCIDMSISVREAMGSYDTITATAAVERFIDVLNNWYIRRSRDRFWRSDIDEDKITVFNTLYTVLRIMCVVVAPLLPMMSEEIYLGLTSTDVTMNNYDNRSVHLESFPKYADVDAILIQSMDQVRAACKAALHIRNNIGIKVRQPLQSVTFVGVANADVSAEMQQLVLDEINVKEWHNLDATLVEKYADIKLQLNLSLLGKRVPNKVQEIIMQNKKGVWQRFYEDGKQKIMIADVILEDVEYVVKLEPKQEFAGKSCAVDGSNGLVMLDTNINESLYIEGIAREIIRFVQQTRKESELSVTDKIKLYFVTNDTILDRMFLCWEGYIKEQTLCVTIARVKPDDESFIAYREIEIDDVINHGLTKKTDMWIVKQ